MSDNNFGNAPHWQQHPYNGPGEAPSAPKKRKRWPWVLGGIVVVGAVVGSVSGGSEKVEPVASSATAATYVPPTLSAPVTKAPARLVPAKPAPAPAAKSPLTTDGTYKVGIDIAPGSYSYVVSPDSWTDSGYWETCASIACEITFDGSDSGMIDNDFVTAPGYLEIPPNAVYVKLQDLDLTPA